jgi:excinuclease ABC subunit C
MAGIEDLKARAAALPARPGIYFFKNAEGEVVYIGKARSLRDRVRSYFLPNPDEKVRHILGETTDIDYILTDSEKEAVFLENNYVQQHQPRFNLRLKDDKSFPYLRISRRDKFPRVSFSRRVEEDGARYFGPFSPADSARKSIHLVNRAFRIRSCEDAVFRGRKRPCLDYDLKLCSGPCVGLISEEDYREDVENACLFLEGRTRDLAEVLKKRMEKDAAEQRYEDAARARDLLRTLEDIREKPGAISAALEDQDIFGFARSKDRAAVYVFLMRRGKIRESAEFEAEASGGMSDAEILGEALARLYAGRTPPPRLVLPFSLAHRAGVPTEKSGASRPGTKLVVPRAGRGRKLVAMASGNAADILLKRDRDIAALRELQDVLGMETLPRVIEGFDISNTGGDESVGSLVLFRDGRPSRGEFRKYRIRTVAGPDDTASLEEVVRRRYARLIAEKRLLPDLVMVDGGKGQLSAAAKGLRGAGAAGLPLVSIAKKEEILFTPSAKGGIRLDRRSEALKIVQRIRDEAHRFAVTYHRKRRSKKSFASGLDGIPGLGPKRKAALLSRYGSLEAIRTAPPEELAGLVGKPAAARLLKKLGGHNAQYT